MIVVGLFSMTVANTIHRFPLINVSEGRDATKNCDLFEFILGNFRFQPKFCNGCHDMTQKSLSFNDVEVVTVERDDYLIRFWNMTKSETMN